nr:protein TORNADO 1 [Tanacetum cinerariifolium]
MTPPSRSSQPRPSHHHLHQPPIRVCLGKQQHHKVRFVFKIAPKGAFGITAQGGRSRDVQQDVKAAQQWIVDFLREKRCSSGKDIAETTLPEEIIESVLTRMPIRDAVRTSVLSRRWRYCWMSMPKVSFDEQTLFEESINDKQMKKYKLLNVESSYVDKNSLVKVPSLQVQSRNDNILMKVEMRRKAVATCLHQIGEVIYFEELGFLILDFEWFFGEMVGKLVKLNE